MPPFLHTSKLDWQVTDQTTCLAPAFSNAIGCPELTDSPPPSGWALPSDWLRPWGLDPPDEPVGAEEGLWVAKERLGPWK